MELRRNPKNEFALGADGNIFYILSKIPNLIFSISINMPSLVGMPTSNSIDILAQIFQKDQFFVLHKKKENLPFKGLS